MTQKAKPELALPDLADLIPITGPWLTAKLPSWMLLLHTSTACPKPSYSPATRTKILFPKYLCTYCLMF